MLRIPSDHGSYVFRKLSLTCQATAKKKALEKRYPALCADVEDVMEGEACVELWKGGGLGGNKTRVDAFEEAMFKYMEDNVALVNIYMKEPYCEEILQEINLTWWEIIVWRFSHSIIAGFLSLLTLVVFLDSVLAAVLSLSWKYSGIVSHPSAGSLDLVKMVMKF